MLELAYHGVRVLDAHAHFPVGWTPGSDLHPILREYNRQRTRRMDREWDFPETRDPVPSVDDEEGIRAVADRWAAEVERYGLERIVFVTGGGNDLLARIVRMHPDKFLGMMHHDPTAPGAVEEARRAYEELGLVAYKMFGPRWSIPFEAPEVRPLWEFLAEHRIPVLIHFGLLGRGGGVAWHERINPLSLFPVARDFPEIPFIVPHFGCGYPRELLHLMWSCPNVYVDTSGSNQWMRWHDSELTLEYLFKKFYETVGPERIIFGSDSSWFPRGFAVRYLQDQLRACYYLGMKDGDIDRIFYRNAAELFGLEPRRRPEDGEGTKS